MLLFTQTENPNETRKTIQSEFSFSELLDFSVGGGEDDSLAGGDLLATQQLFAMLDAVESELTF